ncbi:MAG: hypothetical protein A2289_03870 [Deltaproteobacteria bacterium RIFOXYA12_FULL_58_15]|nr:MAG: hypothetical protein A2289_03870 [Deltaproteobacteria bacterium RIFOXYA12_FULL_58_15]OGR08608.1 MAG: hypothetical protein A2341_00065 [Deltaproteobacteria bacterium RIFOXYB12_FULL_58_9]
MFEQWRLWELRCGFKPERNVDLENEEFAGRGTGEDKPKIRCPKCGWQPGKGDRWQCICDHVWNTFDTRGVCPACHEQWEVTACLSCQQFSPHEDWYEKRS